jgi:hypothetical protein
MEVARALSIKLVIFDSNSFDGVWFYIKRLNKAGMHVACDMMD